MYSKWVFVGVKEPERERERETVCLYVCVCLEGGWCHKEICICEGQGQSMSVIFALMIN